ncbi:permease-like cell division protein FtsX [Saccharomonospora azurea]|uniref:Cell division protein FtsX n=1 Tax=Saccharomonospora azurea NA-128 TaxID=882081 RepID=H8G8C9_9PSEU|nr:permease-like cell division protein FtsX [Saccharomonospora azurea]EHK88083.1 cell division protein FtsX [Saccharomonospora azurea SZMC 14600]EHY90451.1 cell division protein [Saccharomonospora azurea NA-128]
MRASFVFSEVITGLRRNVTMTIAMILTTAISLGMFGGGLLFVRTIDKMKANYLDDVQVTIYLNDEVSSSDDTCSAQTCTTLRQSLETNPGVESVVFENRDQAYERFQEIFEGQPELVELARPESLPSSLHVKLVDPERSDVLVQEYSAMEGVDHVDDQNKFLERFFDILNAGRNGTFIIALIAALAAVLLIANTIQVSAFTRRTEVGIMRLVGATRWYTQLPFLLEAVVAGVLGAVIGTSGLVALKYLVLDSIIESTGGVIPQLLLADILVYAAPILLGTSVLISAVTGYATLRLYVRH